MPNTVWISEAIAGEQGAFCDRDSHYEYQSGNLTDAVEQEAEALDRGDEVVWVDAPIDPTVAYTVQSGQGFNLYFSEADSQGVYTPSPYAPGR